MRLEMEEITEEEYMAAEATLMPNTRLACCWMYTCAHVERAPFGRTILLSMANMTARRT